MSDPTTTEDPPPSGDAAPAQSASEDVIMAAAEPEPSRPAGPTITIKVKFSGGAKFELQVDPDGTLAAAKQQCSEETKVPVEQLRLFLRGKQLKDESLSCKSAGVVANAQIFLVKGAAVEGATPVAAAVSAAPKEEKKEEPETTGPCVGGCGFFGSSRTEFYCSKCWNIKQEKDKVQVETANKAQDKAKAAESAAAAPAAEAEPVEPPKAERPKQENVERCWTCTKKIGMMGFKCRCDYYFCATHRYAEDHECDFDYKEMGQDNLRKANPTVAADKLGR